MNLSIFTKAIVTPGAPWPRPAILVTGFRRLSCRRSNRLLLVGELTYLTGAGQGSVTVSMTWEAYSRLLDVIRSEDVQLPEDIVISSVLQRWGRHQLERSLARGEPAPMSGYVLDFEGGPCSPRPRAILEECLLLERSAPSLTSPTACGDPRPGLRIASGLGHYSGSL